MDLLHPGFRDEFWSGIDDTIELSTSEIYSYVPDADTDAFALGKLWSVNYFFYRYERAAVMASCVSLVIVHVLVLRLAYVMLCCLHDV